MYCAPGKDGSNGTCFDNQAIYKLAKAYNDTTTKKISINRPPAQIYSELSNRMAGRCNNEICWIRQPFAKQLGKEVIEHTFLPEHPSTNLDYKLSTSNISKALAQYQNAYPHFKAIGPVPSDFEEFYNELARINPLQLLGKGIYQIGVVFNTKPSTHSGEHWIALFIDLKKAHINYYDSYGAKPANNIVRLIERIRSYEAALYKGSKKFKVKHNWYPHQTDEYQCGAYCINFLIESLKGTDFKIFIKNLITDEQMKQKRLTMFRPKGI